MPRCERDHRFSIEGGSPCILVLSPQESIMFLTIVSFTASGTISSGEPPIPPSSLAPGSQTN
jgi:hypothetical protein